MTTIAIKGGVLATDSGVCCNGKRAGLVAKAIKHRGGGYVAGSGQLGQVALLFDAIKSGRPLPTSEVNLLWLKPNGEVWLSDDSGPFFPVEAEFVASGSGMSIALGAMAAGASAKEAVEICIDLDVYSFGPVKTFSINGVEA